MNLADFSSAATGVAVDLVAGTATGEGSDALAAIVNVTGSAFADTVTGTAAVNRVVAGGGDDVVRAGEGDDTVYGGTGNDTIVGAGGNDAAFGQDGDDLLRLGAGNDTIRVGRARTSRTSSSRRLGSPSIWPRAPPRGKGRTRSPE